MNLDVQAKLLRAIQEQEFTRVGGTKTQSVRIRFICATNRDLASLCQSGSFRFDLFSRLNTFQLSIPPLRERKEDILILATHFLSLLKTTRLTFSDDAAKALSSYEWPGNVRELANAMQYAVAMADSETIEMSNLPVKINLDKSLSMPAKFSRAPFAVQMMDLEMDLLRKEYKAADGNVSFMARSLQIDRSQLHGKLIRYGIHISKNTAAARDNSHDETPVKACM